MAKYGYWEFDPFEATGIKVPKADRADALDAVASFLKEEMLSRTAEGRTSVKGGRWVKSLSPEYKKIKEKESSVGFANLELTGEMLDSFDVRPKNSKKLVVEVSEEERGKAEGHLTGVYGANDTNKPRQFMPVGDEELAPDILKGVERVLRRFESED